MKVNQQYVKDMVMKEIKSKTTKQKNKRNMNKDKGTMKNNAEIRESL